MPEMRFAVRWPDGEVGDYYSPSLVVHDHLSIGDRLSVSEFRSRTTVALDEAGERVRARYGFLCTSAAESVARINLDSAGYPESALVEVLSMYPPLPTPTSATSGPPSLQEQS